jgi:hypothetical protein
MFKLLEPNFISWNFEKSINSLISCSQKHFKRVDNLIESCNLIDYTISNMNLIVSNDEILKE